MDILSFYAASPYFWFFFTSLFFGAGLSKITRPVKEKGEKVKKEKEMNRKWIFICVYFSAAILLFLAGLFIPGLKKTIESNGNLFIFSIILLVYFFLAFRFKKAIGLPSSFILITLVFFILLFLQSVIAFTGETEIAQVKVHYAKDKVMTVEIIREKEEQVIIDMDGEYFAPVAEVVIFDDFLVFFGYKTWYRFLGFTSFSYEKNDNGLRTYRQEDTDYYFQNPVGISDWLYEFIRENHDSIPGIRTVQVEMDLFKVFDETGVEPEKYRTYSIRIQNDGGIQIIDI